MSFSRKCIVLVNDEFEEKRLKNEAERQKRLDLVYSKSAEIQEIDKELSRTGVSIMGCALGGKDKLQENLENLKDEEALFHLYNMYRDEGGNILFTSSFVDNT